MVGGHPGLGYGLDAGSNTRLVCINVMQWKGYPCIMGVGRNVARRSVGNTRFMSNIVRVSAVVSTDNPLLSASHPNTDGNNGNRRDLYSARVDGERDTQQQTYLVYNPPHPWDHGSM